MYPNTGTKKYSFKNSNYILEYKNDFSQDNIDTINAVFKEAITELKLVPEIMYGELTENR